MSVNSVVFGPQQTDDAARIAAEQRKLWEASMATSAATALMDHPRLCNCLGPQPGETKCPCMLLAEIRQADVMLREGVVIFGQKYRLVPDES